ncbi:MAG: c-type cytochrome [Ectothiorhodospiraceae bacterium]|nr:c-type cytochrome [Ectothiorhodospiraceae bacterium]
MEGEDLERADNIYFQRCAGCHGTLRGGATGPDLLPDNMRELGQRRLERIIALGTEGGMNNFDGILDEEEITLISNYIQMEPTEPPEMSIEDMRERWQVFVQPEDLPTEPQHDRNWENFFVTILRDAGQMAIIDGDTKEVVTKVETGYAVHVAKESSDGRFWYTQGRDGRLSKIDLWMDPPQVTAEVFIAYDARDVAVSHYGEWKDKYVIGGGYWPPHFVITDADTMEPLKVVSTRGYNTHGEYVHEARVAALYNTPGAPTFLVNVKETGQIWQVDYSDIENLRVEMIESKEFLHDGFFDPTGRYFQIAANFSHHMVFVDTHTRKRVGMLNTGQIPHPGPGANWNDPECGPVAGTTHLGEGLMTAWGNDPEGHPDQAWEICFSVETDGPGLFVRSHPNSPNVWIDQAMHPEPDVNQWVMVMNKETRELTPIQVTDLGPEYDAVAVHMEYNQAGDEVWVSVWARGRGHLEEGEIVVYDDKTLEEKARIKGLETPTGKFNVYNRKNHIG